MSNRTKLLLMGRSGSGKTSMRSIIFSNYSAYETQRLGATNDVEYSNLRFLGNMTLNLWDCGGQDIFVENYLTAQRDHIFRMVGVLIHVFDVQSHEVQKDISTFVQCLKYLQEFSPNARVFILVHKMDLVNHEKRAQVFGAMMTYLNDQSKPFGFNLVGFPTSIWEESLLKAWSQIVCSLVPNMNLFRSHLQKFADISEAEEVILFEKTTLLVISHVSGRNVDDSAVGMVESGNSNVYGDNSANPGLDPKRFEKISNIIKTYKLSCSKLRSNLQTLTLQGENCSSYIDNLTNNTFIMVVMPHPTNGVDAKLRDDGSTIVANIQGARKWFEKLELGEYS